MAELVRGEHLAPGPKLADVLARVGRRGPKNDDGMIENRERKAIGDVERVLNDNLDALRRRVADEASHGGIDGGQACSDELRPARES
jgi:hypothetical protein